MSDLIRREDAINAMAELQGIAQSKAELTGISKAWKKIKALPTAPRWVRCEDRLPKDTEQVLCANQSVIIKGDYFYEVCIYRDKTVSRSGFYRYDSEIGFVMEHPVYWMPIEPPKEDE